MLIMLIQQIIPLHFSNKTYWFSFVFKKWVQVPIFPIANKTEFKITNFRISQIKIPLKCCCSPVENINIPNTKPSLAALAFVFFCVVRYLNEHWTCQNNLLRFRFLPEPRKQWATNKLCLKNDIRWKKYKKKQTTRPLNHRKRRTWALGWNVIFLCYGILPSSQSPLALLVSFFLLLPCVPSASEPDCHIKQIILNNNVSLSILFFFLNKKEKRTHGLIYIYIYMYMRYAICIHICLPYISFFLIRAICMLKGHLNKISTGKQTIRSCRCCCPDEITMQSVLNEEYLPSTPLFFILFFLFLYCVVGITFALWQ